MIKKTIKKRIMFPLGTVVEIKTKKGFAYAQVVNEHKKRPFMGKVMRIIPKIYKKAQTDLEVITSLEPSYYCFWFANLAAKYGEVKIVGRAEIPKQHRKFPTFKHGYFNMKTKRYGYWSLWQGNKAHKLIPVDKLTEEQKKYPLLQIVPTSVVIERLVRDWRPEHECE